MTVYEQEEIIRRRNHEWAFVWNDEGLLVLAKEGEAYGVVFTDEEVRLMKGAVVTHNHPYGLNFPDTDPRSFGHSFSEDDIRLACIAEVAEMRSVTPKLRFSMKPSASGWNLRLWETDIGPSYVAYNEEVWQELNVAFRFGTVTSAEAHVSVLHRTWERVAGSLGLTYVREEG